MSNDPFEQLRCLQEDMARKERVKKIAKTIKKCGDKPVSDEDAKEVGHLILGIAHFEDVPLETISDPDVLKKVEAITKLKAFASVLAADAAGNEALSFLRTTLLDDTIPIRDRINAANAILNNKKKQQKEVYEFLDIFKDMFMENVKSKPASQMTNDELAISISNVLSAFKR